MCPRLCAAHRRPARLFLGLPQPITGSAISQCSRGSGVGWGRGVSTACQSGASSCPGCSPGGRSWLISKSPSLEPLSDGFCAQPGPPPQCPFSPSLRRSKAGFECFLAAPGWTSQDWDVPKVTVKSRVRFQNLDSRRSAAGQLEPPREPARRVQATDVQHNTPNPGRRWGGSHLIPLRSEL